MKNYDSKINPYLGVGILGVATPVAVYLIGFLATLLWGFVLVLLFPLFYGGILNEVAFDNITVIVSTVLQVLAIVILTLVLSVFADLKIYHLLISSVVSSILFLIVERFIPMVRGANFPWQWEFFPKFFAKRISVRFDSLNTKQFVELRIYLTTTLILTITFFLISLITWGIYRAASRNKQRGEKL
ncbi:MAG: hypothetical protein K2J80_13220 [Oscillospiraceae bacterium]|nr:hypothetical protein [Oscillospiraceae bacterium]